MAQRFAARPLGIEQIMTGELDVEEIERVMTFGRLEHDAGAIDQVAHRHEEALREHGMRGGQANIRCREVFAERAAFDADRSRMANPASGGRGSLQGKGADRPDRDQAAETGDHPIACGQGLDRAIAIDRSDSSATQEAGGVVLVTATATLTLCRSWPSTKDCRGDRRRDHTNCLAQAAPRAIYLRFFGHSCPRQSSPARGHDWRCPRTYKVDITSANGEECRCSPRRWACRATRAGRNLSERPASVTRNTTRP